MTAQAPWFVAALLGILTGGLLAGERMVVLPGGTLLCLVEIRPGDFTMGDGKGNPDEGPPRRVIIPRALWLGKTELTQAQWQAVMGSNPSEFKGPRRPVETVNWFDAKEFLKRLNARAGDLNFRLPTEAEWEYACRAGSATRYSHGDDGERLGDYAWYRDNSGARKVFGWFGVTHGLNRALRKLEVPWRVRTWGTSDVASKKSNAWGLCDMHGSVWEWCEDLYAGGPQAPLPPGAPETRVLRGGSWYSIGLDCRASNRSRYPPTEKSNVTGLRLAADARP